MKKCHTLFSQFNFSCLCLALRPKLSDKKNFRFPCILSLTFLFFFILFSGKLYAEPKWSRKNHGMASDMLLKKEAVKSLNIPGGSVVGAIFSYLLQKSVTLNKDISIPRLYNLFGSNNNFQSSLKNLNLSLEIKGKDGFIMGFSLNF